MEKFKLEKTIELGEKVIISDPAYNMDTWCIGILNDILPGTYECFYEIIEDNDWGRRIASIEVKNKDYEFYDFSENLDAEIGVDSGQCGIYDYDYFEKNNQKEDWYSQICNLTYIEEENPNYKNFYESKYYFDQDIDALKWIKEYQKYVDDKEISTMIFSRFAADTFEDKCLVSSSGYGDGLYDAFVERNNDGKIIGIKISFIEEEYMEEE